MRLLLIIVSFILLLPSCRKGEVPSSPPTDVEDSDINESIEVKFSSDISASIEEMSLGRAPIEGETMPKEAKVGIYGIPALQSELDKYTIKSPKQANLSNAEYMVYDNGVLKQSNDVYAEYPNDSKYDGLLIYAYYPWTSNIGSDWTYGPVLNIDLESENMENSVDYMVVNRRFAPTPKGIAIGQYVELEFKHALGRLKFVFNKTSSDAVLNGIEVFANSSVSGKLILESGECIPEDNTTENTFRYNCNKKLNSDENLFFDFLLFPGVQINKIQCYITTDKTKSYVIYDKNLTSSQEITLEQGKYTTITVNFSPKEALLSSRVTDWQSSNNDKNYSIDEESETVTEN